jgi:hypothetical protein
MIASSSMCRIFEQSGLSGGPSYPAPVAASNVPAHPLLLSCETISRAYGTRSLFTICRSDCSKEAVLKKILPDRIKLTQGEDGTWRFEGRACYGKLLEGDPEETSLTTKSPGAVFASGEWPCRESRS